MRLVPIAAALCAAALLGSCSDSGETNAAPVPIAMPAPDAPAPKAEVKAGKGFDFYVLALSWSPSYCESEGEDANRQQCGSGRPYAFVVHGLWPQFERGYPTDCRTGQRDVPRDMAANLHDIMPSNGLIRQQWRKHGSCSGLSQADYFDVVRAARQRVAIPDRFRSIRSMLTVAPTEVETAFRDANPGLPADGVSISCDRHYLREVRICLTKGLGFRSCPEVRRRSCRIDRAVMPPVRG